MMPAKTEERILILTPDYKEDTYLIFQLLQRHFYNLQLYVESNEKKILTFFKENKSKLEILIFDHYQPGGITLLHSILRITPGLKVVILSGTPYCSDPHGCEHCRENFRKQRVLKPLDKKLLLNTIRRFDRHRCEYMSQCDTPEKNHFLTQKLR